MHLLFVRDESQYAMHPGKYARTFESILQTNKAIADSLEKQAKSIESKYAIECNFFTHDGALYEAVTEKANDLHCDLIIVESAPRMNFFTASKANSPYKVMEQAACPVLAIPAKKSFSDFKRILFPVRSVSSAIQKLEATLPIIKKNNSSLRIFPFANKNQQPAAEIGEALLSWSNRIFKNAGRRNTEVCVTNDMAQVVVNEAIEKQSDLIVMRGSLKKGLKALFFKNDTERVIDQSPVPVLLVKKKV